MRPNSGIAATSDWNLSAGTRTVSVEFCRFDNLRAVEREKRLEASWLQPRNERDPESFKVRKGKVGGYGEYLSPDEVAELDEMIERYGCAFTRPADVAPAPSENCR